MKKIIAFAGFLCLMIISINCTKKENQTRFKEIEIVEYRLSRNDWLRDQDYNSYSFRAKSYFIIDSNWTCKMIDKSDLINRYKIYSLNLQRFKSLIKGLNSIKSDTSFISYILTDEPPRIYDGSDYKLIYHSRVNAKLEITFQDEDLGTANGLLYNCLIFKNYIDSIREFSNYQIIKDTIEIFNKRKEVMTSISKNEHYRDNFTNILDTIIYQ